MWDELKKRFSSTDSAASLVLGLAVVVVLGALLFNYIKDKQPVPGTTTTAPGAGGQTEQMQPVSSPTTHTVASGDTLWSVSQKYYKTGYNWVDLVEANNLADANRIEIGQTLKIPLVTPIVPQGQVAGGMMAKKPEQTSYTVVRGDTLWAIAVKQYNDGYKWSSIAAINKLANPDLIHAGNVLVLP